MEEDMDPDSMMDAALTASRAVETHISEMPTVVIRGQPSLSVTVEWWYKYQQLVAEREACIAAIIRHAGAATAD
jgi:hypothetical protein